jgi:hypothetical protein
MKLGFTETFLELLIMIKKEILAEKVLFMIFQNLVLLGDPTSPLNQ